MLYQVDEIKSHASILLKKFVVEVDIPPHHRGNSSNNNKDGQEGQSSSDHQESSSKCMDAKNEFISMDTRPKSTCLSYCQIKSLAL